MSDFEWKLSFTDILTLRNVAILFTLWAISFVLRTAYNVSPFHPLHKFPGPKLAYMSYLYEFYFDVIKSGRYSREIKRFHEIYGPIVRINPHELHCNDPDFINEIYTASGRKRNKDFNHLNHFTGGGAHSHFATAEYDLHRRRRAPLQKFFSKGQISKLEPEIHKLAQQLCSKILAEAGTEKDLELTSAYSCFTSDVISEYCFGEPFGFIAQDSFEPNFKRTVYALLSVVHKFRFFPWLRTFALAAPYMSSFMPKDMALIGKTLEVDIPNRVKKAKAQFDAGISQKRLTIFEALFSSDLPPKEKTVFRLSGEGAVLLGAGTETTSWALSVTTFHLLNAPRILNKLTQELQTVVEDPQHLPSWSTLEKLPYLSAVILEGLRLSYGVSFRSPRVAIDEDLVYHGVWSATGLHKEDHIEYIIPRGTAIGMSGWMVHHNETIFPNSTTYIPERWLDEKGERQQELEKYFLSFSKGSRQCLAMNLAYCELHLALTALVLRVCPHMQLYETTVGDVEYDHDMFVPMTKKTSKGVRVLIN